MREVFGYSIGLKKGEGVLVRGLIQSLYKISREAKKTVEDPIR